MSSTIMLQPNVEVERSRASEGRKVSHSTKSQAVRALLAGIAALLLTNAAGAAKTFAINGLTAQVDWQGMDYPPTLRRLGVSGRVVLAYSVGPSGEPEKVAVLVSDDSRLEKPALDYLGHIRFDVPKTWASDAEHWRRFHLQFTFAFEGNLIPPKLVEDGDVITVTASILKLRP